MSEFPPIATLTDLNALDEKEVIEGYLDYKRGDPEPGSNRGRAFWHEWMNAARDDHARPMTPESRQLAHEVVNARSI